jgi:membrane-bound serine protease (ClpP class)
VRILLLLLSFWISGATAQAGGPVVVLTQTGAIGPAGADYLHRGIEHAAKRGAQLIVLRMDTPGGLDLSMRTIIHDILASPVPVVTFVAPAGARAASAGTYILYASHIAAMAPATNLGAATPVNLGPQGPEPGARPAEKREGKADDAPGPSNDQAMQRKQINDSAAYIRSLAQLRGRNADWAERAVREAVSLSANEALERKVIDVVADDLPQLLRNLDGRSVPLAGGTVTLATLTAEIVPRDLDWRTRLLAVITDPGIAYILLLVGIYGLLFEFMNPGFAIPGVIGGICLLLALFALQLLPVSYAGLALMALGVALFVVEFFTAGVGILGMGGIVAFVAGSVMLIDTDAPGYSVPPGLVGGIAAASAVGLLVLVRMAVAARRRPIVSGREQLVGSTGVVLSGGETPYVIVEGERWKARTAVSLQPGDRVRVVRIDGLVLDVEALERKPERKE